MKKLGFLLVLLVLGACGDGDTIYVGESGFCDVEGEKSAVIYISDQCTNAPIQVDTFKVDGEGVDPSVTDPGVYTLKCYDPDKEGGHNVTIQAEGYEGYLDADVTTDDVAFSISLMPLDGCEDQGDPSVLRNFANCINSTFDPETGERDPVGGYRLCCAAMASWPEIANLCEDSAL